jgi:hypothetical protein
VRTRFTNLGPEMNPMKKLTLDLEAIAVESFDASPAEDALFGTVRAHDAIPTPVVKTLPPSACVFSACNTCGIYC